MTNNTLTVDGYIKQCLSHFHVKLTPPEIIIEVIPLLRKAGFVIHTMECAKLLEGGWQQPNFEFAMLGLLKNGDDDWEVHKDPNRITKAAVDVLTGAMNAGGDYLFEVWINEIED